MLSDFVWKALIFDVIVAPDSRGSGIGTMLIETILTHPRLARVRHFELYSRPDMEPFYQCFGFSAGVGDARLMRREARAQV